MVRTHRFWCGVAALGLGLLAGCQHGAPRQSQSTPLLADSRPTPRLKGNQVADVQFALGRSAEQRGELAQAVAFYQQTLKQDPDRADAWHRLAVVHDRQGKFRESAEMYRKALAAQPGNPAVFCDVGYSFYLQGRLDEAEMNLRQAIALQPEHARAHNNLGVVLARSGRDAEALAEFRKGGCDDADAHTNLAFALILERRCAEAREHYQRALAAAPSSDRARKGLQELDAVAAKVDPEGHGRTASRPTAPARPEEPAILPVIWKSAAPAGRPPAGDEAVGGATEAKPREP